MDQTSTICRYITEFVRAVLAGVCPASHLDGDGGTLSALVLLLTHKPFAAAHSI